MITAEDRARVGRGEPDLTFVDDVWKAPRALPAWWIGSSQLERIGGFLEVIDHEVPIESTDAPPAERQNLYTGRRIVKLWSVGDRKVADPPQGGQPTEAPQSALPPGASKSRQVDHLRYEKGGRTADADPLPPDHYATHEPADARCPICEAVKLTKQGAGKVAEGTGVKTKDLKYLDIVGMTSTAPCRSRT